MKTVNLNEKLGQFSSHWDPHVIADYNENEVMVVKFIGEYPFHKHGDDLEAAYLWRLMIAADRQGRGLGRAAITMALQVAREWGCPRLTASVSDVAHSNMGFYQRQGFHWTGRFDEGEKVITRDV